MTFSMESTVKCHCTRKWRRTYREEGGWEKGMWVEETAEVYYVNVWSPQTIQTSNAPTTKPEWTGMVRAADDLHTARFGENQVVSDTVIEGSRVHLTCPTHLLSCGFAVLLNRIRLYFSTQVKLDFSISLALSHVKREEMASTLIECFSQCSSERARPKGPLSL